MTRRARRLRLRGPPDDHSDRHDHDHKVDSAEHLTAVAAELNGRPEHPGLQAGLNASITAPHLTISSSENGRTTARRRPDPCGH